MLLKNIKKYIIYVVICFLSIHYISSSTFGNSLLNQTPFSSCENNKTVEVEEFHQTQLKITTGVIVNSKEKKHNNNINSEKKIPEKINYPYYKTSTPISVNTYAFLIGIIKIVI